MNAPRFVDQTGRLAHRILRRQRLHWTALTSDASAARRLTLDLFTVNVAVAHSLIV
jgi:hypothetical protein